MSKADFTPSSLRRMSARLAPTPLQNSIFRMDKSIRPLRYQNQSAALLEVRPQIIANGNLQARYISRVQVYHVAYLVST